MTIDFLGQDEPADEFAETISRAFAEYPVMVRAFPEDRQKWIKQMVRTSALVRKDGQALMPVARIEGRIVGAAFVMMPGYEVPAQHKDWFTNFLAEAGPAAEDFFPRFLAAMDFHAHPNPHVYLVMLGVDPDFQGKGIGKALIEKVVEMARGVPGCQGVALDTEDAINVAKYQACGFEVAAEAKVDDMPIWLMWKAIEGES